MREVSATSATAVAKPVKPPVLSVQRPRGSQSILYSGILFLFKNFLELLKLRIQIIMADKTEQPNVDETHISPIERRNSLEKHLQTRPDPKDLKDRHILLDTNAAPFVSPTSLEIDGRIDNGLVLYNQLLKIWNGNGQPIA